MKKLVLSLTLALAAATLAMAQSTLDLTAVVYDSDPTGVFNGVVTNNGSQTAPYAPFLEGKANYWYSAKLDGNNTVKAGVLVDYWTGLYQGNKAPFQPGQFAIDLAPQVQWAGYGFTAKTIWHTYVLNPANSSGYNAWSYVVGTAASFTPLSNQSKYPYASNNVLLIPYWLANWKYSFASDLSLTLGAESQTTIVPTFWVDSIKPQFTVNWGPWQLDSKYDFYRNFGTATASQYTNLYFEDKLWYQFGATDFGGFRPYLYYWGKIASNGSQYNSANPFHGQLLEPGVVWTLGDLAVDGNFYYMFGYDSSDANDVSTFNGGAPSTKLTPYFYTSLSVTYTFKF